MDDATLWTHLNPPREPRTGGEILRHIKATGEWRVDRVMGSAGDFVVEVTYLPQERHGSVICRRRDDDTYDVQAVHSHDVPVLTLAGVGPA